jgi:hypothetical protein
MEMVGNRLGNLASYPRQYVTALGNRLWTGRQPLMELVGNAYRQVCNRFRQPLM